MLHEIFLLKIHLLRGVLSLCIDPETQKCRALPPKSPQRSLIGLIKSSCKHICRRGMPFLSSQGFRKEHKFDVFSAVDKFDIFAHNSHGPEVWHLSCKSGVREEEWLLRPVFPVFWVHGGLCL
jgi:hypothetical protein